MSCSADAIRNAFAQANDDLCRDLVGVLEAINDSLEGRERCLGCGTKVDADKPCETCISRRRRAS